MYFSIHYENGPYSYEVTINTESDAEQVLSILEQFAHTVIRQTEPEQDSDE